MSSYSDRLTAAVRRKGPLCVGLDPRWEQLPESLRAKHRAAGLLGVAAAYAEFCNKVLELAAPFAGVVKPQAAFFELAGPDGMRALRAVLRRAREMGYVTILDAKRGDIAGTAVAYADAAFGGATIDDAVYPVWDADALTVNPYLGEDAVEPFIGAAQKADRGLFVLVRTSNAGAGLFQDRVCDGKPLYRHVGDAVAKWDAAAPGTVGAVVGATRPRELAELRAALPGVWFLVPGYGAQGGSAADVRAAYWRDGLGAVVNSSRGVTFPFRPDDPEWEAKITAAAHRASEELRAAG
jgi:orotidine-5'-phosphate decarboxylase